MKLLIKILWIFSIFMGLFGVISFLVIFFSPVYHICKFSQIDVKLASDFGQFFGGFVGTIFTTTATLLIVLTFLIQREESQKNQCESHFFKMLDYHNNIVYSIKVRHIKTLSQEKIEGKRAFVIFRLQLIKLLEIVEKINIDLKLSLKPEEIVNIAYIAFYYGIDEEWKTFLSEKISVHKDNADLIVDNLIRHKDKIQKESSINIGRTNQTSLSSYFRNMYNAIKYVDTDKSLSDSEKAKLIKIFRAQLSNPELYVLYLNILSRFGKKWRDGKPNLVTKYEFIKNIPNDYCGEYSPSKFFEMKYEENEYE